MKRVVIVSNTGWYLFNFRFELIKALANKYDITLIFPFDEFTEPLLNIGCKVINWRLKRNSINPIVEISSLIHLIYLFRKIKPELSHHFTIKSCLYGTISGRLSGVRKIINSITGLGHVFLAKKVNSFFYKLIIIPIYRLVFKQENVYLIFQNHEDRKCFLNLKIVTNNKSFLIRGSGVDIDFYKRRNVLEKIDTDQIIKILFPARIIREKGILELISACQSIRRQNIDLRIFIPSDANYYNRSALTKKQMQGLREKNWIEFLGHVKDVKSLYEKVHMVILPSWREGLSMSLLEASSMECSIITTNVPGCNDIVNHGISGLLVPKMDPESIELAIKLLINNSDLVKNFGKNARTNTIKNFNSQIILKQTLCIYES